MGQPPGGLTMVKPVKSFSADKYAALYDTKSL